MQTKPSVVIYTGTCAAKSPIENDTCADVTDAGKSRTASRSGEEQATLKIASKWVTGKVIPSLEQLTKKSIVTLVQRKSGFAVLAEVLNKSADLVGRAIDAKLKPLSSQVKTLTVDNGKEFALHQAIDQALGIQTYFADPYCSWQRGRNESFNGLLRKCIPKKRRIETATHEELTMIENSLITPQKAAGIQDTPRGVSRLVKPCCSSYLNPPINTYEYFTNQ
jgi:IS30 family transposase